MARYTVRTDMPAATRALGFEAWINDAQHPADPDDPEGLSCSWCQDIRDAERIAAALNRDDEMRAAIRGLNPPLEAPPAEVADPGTVRLGDSSITAVFPPVAAKGGA